MKNDLVFCGRLFHGFWLKSKESSTLQRDQRLTVRYSNLWTILYTWCWHLCIHWIWKNNIISWTSPRFEIPVATWLSIDSYHFVSFRACQPETSMFVIRTKLERFDQQRNNSRQKDLENVDMWGHQETHRALWSTRHHYRDIWNCIPIKEYVQFRPFILDKARDEFW